MKPVSRYQSKSISYFGLKFMMLYKFVTFNICSSVIFCLSSKVISPSKVFSF